MMSSAAQSQVTEFLRVALAGAPISVSKIEEMARAAHLLGERQRITNAKLFRRAKESLAVKSVREGFGTGGGWFWELPSNPDVASAPLPITRLPVVRTKPHVPTEWVEGVARLPYQCPLAEVPPHRWRQFVQDCHNFLNSREGWAERAARLGWDAWVLFGCRRPGGAGLLWAVGGGRLVELHRDWAVIELAQNGSQRIFERRRVDASNISLPWTEQSRNPRGHR
jgi:hypothetical protein